MGRTSLSVTDDMLEAGVNVVVETALNAAVPGVGTVAMTTVGLAGYGVDKVTGLGDLPSVSNNLIYSVDSTQKLYRVYQKDYEAYQKNPSDANLKKAVDSYASYEHAIADMKQAEADFYNMTNRSFAGGVVNFMSGSMGPDTIHEGAAQDYRSNAEKADRLLKQYQKYRS